MAQSTNPNKQAEAILDTPHLVDVLDDQHFKDFLDHLPLAIAVSHLVPSERISYANPAFERLCSVSLRDLIGNGWEASSGAGAPHEASAFVDAIVSGNDAFEPHVVGLPKSESLVNIWSNLISDATGQPVYRLVAFTPVPREIDDFNRRLQEKDLLLRELQHRVSNNLQMITALIRMEARSPQTENKEQQFSRLAGRVDSLAVLYRSMSDAPASDRVDLGSYLSEIASSVMHAHATEGVRLDLKVDSWPVSVNVAMPTGLVVNELLTNALKHAFVGREGGTITLHSLVDDTGCKVVVSDDGVGLVEPAHWPRQGKLAALIVQSLKTNAKAQVDVSSRVGLGLRVSITFDREAAIPVALPPQI